MRFLSKMSKNPKITGPSLILLIIGSNYQFYNYWKSDHIYKLPEEEEEEEKSEDVSSSEDDDGKGGILRPVFNLFKN